MMLRRGDLVEIDGILAVVIGLAGETVETADGGELVPDDHVALWFGEPWEERSSRGGKGGAIPEIWTVPLEFCWAASKPAPRH